MEYFASDPRILQDISHHYQTGEKLSLDALEQYVASRKVFIGPDIQSQLCYSLLDQKLHTKIPFNSGSTTDIMREIHQEHHSLPFADGTAWQHRFSHLVRRNLLASIYLLIITYPYLFSLHWGRRCSEIALKGGGPLFLCLAL